MVVGPGLSLSLDSLFKYVNFSLIYTWIISGQLTHKSVCLNIIFLSNWKPNLTSPLSIYSKNFNFKFFESTFSFLFSLMFWSPLIPHISSYTFTSRWTLMCFENGIHSLVWTHVSQWSSYYEWGQCHWLNSLQANYFISRSYLIYCWFYFVLFHSLLYTYIKARNTCMVRKHHVTVLRDQSCKYIVYGINH